MQVKSKIFPYPVINHDANFSNYANNSFELVFEEYEEDSAIVLKNCHFETNSKEIQKLFEEQKIGIVLVVECSATVYRKAYEMTTFAQDVYLSKCDFVGKVEVSMFAYAKESFILDSDEYDEDYQGIPFEIDKYSIIGANDGFHMTFTPSEMADNLSQSIFSIIVNEELPDGAYLVECNVSRKIQITLSKKDYEYYKAIYTFSNYKEVFFNMLLVPALIEGLSLCKVVLADESKDFDDVSNQYTWFRSILMAYKKLKGKDLTIQDFKTSSPILFAQELLGKPLGTALQNLVEARNNSEDAENE